MAVLRLALFLAVALAASAAEAQTAPGQGADEGPQVQRGGYGHYSSKRWRPEPPPRTADEARDPAVEEAMRSAPLLDGEPLPYGGTDKALQAARKILKSIPTFLNFRASIAKATWRVDPAYEWRVRPTARCLADLGRLGLQVKRYQPEAEEGAAPTKTSPEDEEPLDPTPAPLHVRSPIGGVQFHSAQGASLLISCELASRLPLLARVVARHGVDQVFIASAYRQQPRTSFHTMGLALDIARMHLTEPLAGPEGESSPWLTVLTDFLETPELSTCDPSLLDEGSPLGDNERGRRLLRIACDLHASGAFSSVLTPNYNPGHRDHFHVDIRPDDPRLFLR